MNLERAIRIAAAAHEGQVDKAGAPYITHALRVMLKQETIERGVLAVLHDVVEDTHWTFENLREQGLADHMIAKLELLTRIDGQDYTNYIERLARDPDTRAVKMADLWDNMNINRIPEPTKKDWTRLAKYTIAYKRLKDFE